MIAWIVKIYICIDNIKLSSDFLQSRLDNNYDNRFVLNFDITKNMIKMKE